jgi:hypothetical protein
MFRFISSLFVLISVFLLPNFVTAIFLFFLIFIFDNFFEAIIFAYIMDVLYRGGTLFGFNSPYLFTFIFIFIFLISFKLKTVLKFYERK